MDPNFEYRRFVWHNIMCDPFERLLTIDEIFPNVSLESHSFEDETTRRQKAFVIVHSCDYKPDNSS